MGFSLDEVVPWGRSYDEYVAMFGLGSTELAGCILGCADGPASFNAEGTARGGRVVSIDPLYQLSESVIRTRIEDTREQILAGARANRESYVWTRIRSIEELRERRTQAMERFLDDYPAGLDEGRYRTAELPVLPFADQSFDLALCSHFLFTYSEILSEDFHFASLGEMCRVAREARVFPLLNSEGDRSPHLDPLWRRLVDRGYAPQIRTVPYEFQRGGNEMLVVARPV